MTEQVLISGGTGYIAGHTIAQLLEAGYRVTATVRDPLLTDALAYLTDLPGASDRLTLVQADLTSDDPFSLYVAEADYVLHMASPYVVSVKDPQRDLLEPAVHGTVSMMKACAAAPNVKRVVVTSSMAAITDEPDENHTLTEADWNTRSSLERNPYYYSKVRAEKSAWEFVEENRPDWDLITINPFLVMGPSLSARLNESPKVVADMLTGQFPAIMPLTWGIVDVRDVATAHVRAMTAPQASGRYVCAAEVRTMRQVVDQLKSHGFAGAKLPSMSMESSLGLVLAKLAANFQPPGVRSYLRTHLGRTPRFDNSKIKRDLDLEFRDVDETVVETARDLVKWGHVPQPS